MAYRIPSEEEVVKAIDNVMVRNPHVRSQTELYSLVSTELLCMDEGYRISGSRIRRIGIRHGLFTISISYARSSRRHAGDGCPVCGNTLESVRNRTLDWDTVEMRRVCRECGYSARSDAEKPARYVIDRRV